MKRTIDVTVSATCLLALAPLMGLLALLVRLDSPGPALYRGRRVGRHGRPFLQLKLRSMIADAGARGGPCTSRGDPRITRIGRTLRRWKLDELPQLWNVLRGDMSLVGPRPEVEAYVRLLEGEERDVLSVRPGITDWATLWNADEEAFLARQDASPEVAYQRRIRPVKVRLQLEYARRCSLGTDLLILVLTARRVLGVRRRPRALERLLEALRGEGLVVPELEPRD